MQFNTYTSIVLVFILVLVSMIATVMLVDDVISNRKHADTVVYLVLGLGTVVLMALLVRILQLV